MTPAVRKIFQSQKTFANHLSDAEAASALAASQSHIVSQAQSTPRPSSPSITTPRATPLSSHLTSTGKRSHRRRDANASTPLRRVSTALDLVSTPAPTASPPPQIKREPEIQAQVVMFDIDDSTPMPEPHPGDVDPLLMSRVPPMPTIAEMEALLAAPALTYGSAKARLGPEGWSRPQRTFCEICGYWGRARCGKCGARICGLECKGTHEQTRCVRFYA